MSMILRIAAAFLDRMYRTGPDVHDTQLAIKQILLRSGWGEIGGRVTKRVKHPFKSMPVLVRLEEVGDGDLIVRDQGGRVLSKVDVSELQTNAQIMDAARKLNNGIQQVVAR